MTLPIIRRRFVPGGRSGDVYQRSANFMAGKVHFMYNGPVCCTQCKRQEQPHPAAKVESKLAFEASICSNELLIFYTTSMR